MEPLSHRPRGQVLAIGLSARRREAAGACLMTMEFHSLCLALPDMSAEAFQALVEDIRSNGLRHDVVLHEGLILDGRHRYRACLECGIEPRFVTFDGSDPLAFVISENVTRRHLNESQRAMVASRLANRPVGRTV